MPWTVRWLVAGILLSQAACSPPPNVQTFPGPKCPEGWTFLYTDHPRDAVVCSRDTTRATSRADARGRADAWLAIDSF